MFWADKIAEDLKNRKDLLWVDDMFTPSGKAHVGSLRGAIIHDVIAKALKNAGHKVKYTFFANDFDPMDGIPAHLNKKKYLRHMGEPMFMIPAPEGKGSFADYYGDEFIAILKPLGCKFEYIKDSKEYKKGAYDEVIKIVLDNAKKIRRIYKEVSGSEKPKDWYPFQPICERCGKLGTTRVYAWDSKKVSYVCEENIVKWAKGCGFRGQVSPFGGTGKMTWKVEWPAKWKALGINVEGEGKDHASAGGSRDLANHLCREIFHIEPPYDFPYEHIIFGGKKMSASKGIGISAEDAKNSLPPEIIRFIMIRNPNRALELDLVGTTIPSFFDEYDRAREAFIGKIDFPDLARTFEFSQAKKDFNKGFQVRFSKIAYAVQMPNVDIKKMAIEEKGSKLSKEEADDLNSRIKYAKGWLSNYAPDEFKFEIQSKLPKINLNSMQKNALVKLSEIYFTKKSWKGEDLHAEIYKIKETLGAEPKEVFGAIYKIFLGKESGPQAGWLLASLDYNFVLKRLKEAIK